VNSRQPFLGFSVDAVSMQHAVERVDELVRAGRGAQVLQLNAVNLVASRKLAPLADAYRQADLLTADGMGIYYASRVIGRPIPEMVSGVHLMLEVARLAQARGYGVYVLGAKPDVVGLAVSALQSQFPGVRVVGYRDGYIASDAAAAVHEGVDAAGAEIVFVGMSTPLKEFWIRDHAGRHGMAVCIGVGGSLDVLAGLYTLAPQWMRALALEWLYRVIQEPRRLWKRYAYSLPVFIALTLREAVRARFVTLTRAHPR